MSKINAGIELMYEILFRVFNRGYSQLLIYASNFDTLYSTYICDKI